MEAKVDIEKLQVLNDRIAQTIDALNQVRLSVHGAQQSLGAQQALGGPAAAGAAQVWPGGISHSPYTQIPTAGVSPFVQTPWLAQQMQGGLAHTMPYGIGRFDPNVASRIAQTFPFAQHEYLPFAY